MKLIQTQDYLLLIDEEAEIKEGDFIYIKEHALNNPIKVQKIINLQVRLDSSRFMILDQPKEDCKKIIAYRKLNEEAKELDLPLLPDFKSEYTAFQIIDMLVNICKATYPQFEEWIEYKEVEKFKTSQQAKSQYSLEDMKKAIEMAREGNFSNYEYYGYVDWVNSEEKIIQSLSTQKLPKEFILSDKFSTFEENIKNGKYKW